MSAGQVLAYPADHPRAWRSIVAEVVPDSAGVLRSTYGRETVEEMSAREGVALRLMSWGEWREGAAAAQAAPVSWVRTTQQRHDYAFEVLPPLAWSGSSFLVSEPADHCFKTGAPRYHGYREHDGRHYATSRPVTVAELRNNRATAPGVPWA